MNFRCGLSFTLIVLITVFISCKKDISKTSSFRDIFDYYRTKEGITALSAPPSLIGLLMSQSNGEDNELAILMKDLSAFRIISLGDSGKYENMKNELFQTVNDFTIRNRFNDFLVIRNSEENLIIRMNENSNIVSEAIIMFSGKEGLTVIDFRGNIKPENIARLAEAGTFSDLESFYSH